MNSIPAVIQEIACSSGVAMIDMLASNQSLTAILADGRNLPPWITKGATVCAVFNEAELSIAVDLSGKISLRNRLPCIVKDIQGGEIMSLVALQFGPHLIHSAITTRAVQALNLKEGMQVTALIKANEVALFQT